MDKNSDVERGQDATANCNVAEKNPAGVNPIAWEFKVQF
jgi:hypothetical protein